MNILQLVNVFSSVFGKVVKTAKPYWEKMLFEISFVVQDINESARKK